MAFPVLEDCLDNLAHKVCLERMVTRENLVLRGKRALKEQKER